MDDLSNYLVVSWTHLPNVVQLKIWFIRGRPCFSCRLECVRNGTYAHTTTWSICLVQKLRFVIYVWNSHTQLHSKSVDVLPGWQTVVCHMDVALISATMRTGSRLKWNKSIHHRTSWGNKCHMWFYLWPLKWKLMSHSMKHCDDNV